MKMTDWNAKLSSNLSIRTCNNLTIIVHRRETYKYYSGVDPVGLISSIGNNVCSEIISGCREFIDGKTFKLTDLDLNFVATNSGIKKNNPRNPERQLVRYQFMEFLVRITIDKFVKSKSIMKLKKFR